MKRKFFGIAVLAAFLGLVAACGFASPEAVVKDFFEAAKKQDQEGMSATLAESAGRDFGFDEDSSSDPLAVYLKERLKANAGKISYQIVKVETVEEESRVSVSVRYVDEGPLLKAVLGEYLLRAFQLAFSSKEPSEEEMDQLLYDVFKEQDEALEESFKEAELEVRLVREDGKWRIAEVTEGMKDALTSGIYSAGSEMEAVLD